MPNLKRLLVPVALTAALIGLSVPADDLRDRRTSQPINHWAHWRSRARWRCRSTYSATDREELCVVALRAQPALSQVLHERAKVVEAAALDPQGTVGAPPGPKANLIHAAGSALEQVARLVHDNQLRRITDRVQDLDHLTGSRSSTKSFRRPFPSDQIQHVAEALRSGRQRRVEFSAPSLETHRLFVRPTS
jgi:hypothetical protein